MDAPTNNDQQLEVENESNEIKSLLIKASRFHSPSDSDTDDSDTDSTDTSRIDTISSDKEETVETLRTQNEIIKIPITKPTVEIRDDMPIDEIGSVYNIVDNAVIVIAKVSGEYRVLDSGSIFVFEDRKMLGEVRSISGRG